MRALCLLCISALMLVSPAYSQKWMSTEDNEEKMNFYEIQNKFKQYWGDSIPGKGDGWKQFKRWEHFWENRVYPSGNFPDPMHTWNEWKKMKESQKSKVGVQAANQWRIIGPTKTIPKGGGAGRINILAFDPSGNDVIWAGSCAGGLWKSTDLGETWSTKTDELPTLGVSGIAINPKNPNEVYIATGDGNGGYTFSVGVLKSTDGGNTWNPTGLNWKIKDTRTTSKLLINPIDPNIVICAASNGIFRTTNAGTSWSQVGSGNFKDLEFKPGDPSVVYGSTANGSILRSTNSGSSFTELTSLPRGFSRIALGVTDANKEYLYALCANGSVFGALYRSTNSGSTWTLMSNSPNVLGYSTNGSDTRGQAFYDLAIAVSNTNANDVYVGGINIWRSIDGGRNWTLNAHWTGGAGRPYVHADIHDLAFFPESSTLFAACDGGVFTTSNNGNSWNDISDGLEILQLYKIGVNPKNPSQILGGSQDNGTNRYNGSTWQQVYGGDGMECMFAPDGSGNAYCTLYYGDVFRSQNFGANFPSNIRPGTTANGAWVTPFAVCPSAPRNFYGALREVYKSTSYGAAWTKISTTEMGTSPYTTLNVAPSNEHFILAGRSNNLWKTTNSGTNWSNITASGLPFSKAALSGLDIHLTNQNLIAATFSGYVETEKVYVSIDGGTSWSNWTKTGLPNCPVNCALWVVNKCGTTLYVGTDIGVYSTTEGSSTWTSVNDGLPNTIINDLEIAPNSSMLKAGTFGRGIWEMEIGVFEPTAAFVSEQTNVCKQSAVQIINNSTNSPTSFMWEFEGATPSTSTEVNPVVQYNNAGVYGIKLTAISGCGSNVINKQQYIKVAAPTTALTISASKTNLCKGDTALLTLQGSYTNVQWSNGETKPAIQVTEPGTYFVTGTDNSLGCWSKSNSITVEFLDKPTVSISYLGSKRSPICEGDTIVLRTLNTFTSYKWNTGDTTRQITVRNSGEYSLTVTNPGTCDGTSNSISIVVIPKSAPLLKDKNTLTTSYEGTYQWYKNGVLVSDSTASTFTVSENADYYAVVTTKEGCIVTTQPLGVVVGVEETTNIVSTFNLKPNPAEDELQIVFASLPAQNTSIEIIDLQGKVLQTMQANSSQVNLNIHSLARGSYIVRIKNGKQISTKSFQKM